MKTVEFHQAQIVVDAKVIDGETASKRRFAFEVLMDTDAEWAAVRKQVADGLKQLQEQFDANGD
jgi:hypothetical protein